MGERALAGVALWVGIHFRVHDCVRELHRAGGLMDELAVAEIKFVEGGVMVTVVKDSDRGSVVAMSREYYVRNDSLELLQDSELVYWYEELVQAAREFAWRAEYQLREDQRAGTPPRDAAVQT